MLRGFLKLGVILAVIAASPAYEITSQDVFDRPDVSGEKISFFGVKIGDPLDKALKAIPGFKSILERSRKALFEDAFVEYSPERKVTRIGIGKSFAKKFKGKTRELFSDSIFQDSSKRYGIIQPLKEIINVKTIVLDKIEIKEYTYRYPTKGISIIATKEGDKITFNYLVLEEAEK